MLGIDQPASAQRGNPEVQFDGQTIDQMVAAFMKQHRIPGMTLAIVQAPYIPRVAGYGVSDAHKGLLASPKTLWPVGQMTQAYTAVAVMQLIEADKLALDDPVGKHIANLPLRGGTSPCGSSWLTSPDYRTTRSSRPFSPIRNIRPTR